jgi:heavy metal sensor kinase
VRRPRSLRARLTLWYTTVAALSLGFYSVGIYTILLGHLYGDLDLQLHEEIEIAASRIDVAPDGTLVWQAGEGVVPAEEEPAGARWVEVWSVDGKRLLRASSAEPEDLGPAPRHDPRQGSRTLTLPSGLHVRTLTKEAWVGGRALLVRAAHSETPTRQQLSHLLWGLALVVPVALLLSGLLGYALVTRLLAPVSEMAERSEQITAERLEERLPVGNPTDELGRLATAFNRTLARLERSFEQLRRFTADASHELRTPLTALRSVGEVGLKGPKDAAGYREVIGSMLEEADRLTRVVDTLLVLTRADAGQEEVSLHRVDLADVAREASAQLLVLAEERHQALSVEPEEGVHVRGDPLVLRQAVVNLLDNAIKYGRQGTPVRVVVRRREGQALVEVIDRGAGIPEEHRERIFDRFYRVDRSRSREMGGAGLGLSIVRWAVQAHGGHVELESEVGEGSTFRIALPAWRALPTDPRTEAQPEGQGTGS